MWCDSPPIASADTLQPSPSNWSKQLSFVYQPGVGLYDKKKIEDLKTTSTIDDVDQRIQSLELSSPLKSDIDSPNTKSLNLYSSDDTLSDKNNHHIKIIDNNIQENNQKRKFDQNLYSNKKNSSFFIIN